MPVFDLWPLPSPSKPPRQHGTDHSAITLLSDHSWKGLHFLSLLPCQSPSWKSQNNGFSTGIACRMTLADSPNCISDQFEHSGDQGRNIWGHYSSLNTGRGMPFPVLMGTGKEVSSQIPITANFPTMLCFCDCIKDIHISCPNKKALK